MFSFFVRFPYKCATAPFLIHRIDIDFQHQPPMIMIGRSCTVDGERTLSVKGMRC